MNIDQAYRLEILSRMTTPAEFIEKSGWGKTWTYEMIKKDIKFTLGTAMSAADGVSASYYTVHRAAKKRMEGSK